VRVPWQVRVIDDVRGQRGLSCVAGLVEQEVEFVTGFEVPVFCPVVSAAAVTFPGVPKSMRAIG
jgi:hypothetical protein